MVVAGFRQCPGGIFNELVAIDLLFHICRDSRVCSLLCVRLSAHPLH